MNKAIRINPSTMEGSHQLSNGNGPIENGHHITRHGSYRPSEANGYGPDHTTRHSPYPPSVANGNGPTENGHHIMRHSSYPPSIKPTLAWLDLKVFYVRITHCEMGSSTPEYLQLNHTLLNCNTLLEVNGSRTNTYWHTPSILRRDRLDKKSEEVTFVCTDSIKVTGSVKFEVFDKDVLLISGVLELCNGHNGCNGESEEDHGKRWNMSLSHDVVNGDGFLKGRPNMGLESGSPRIEVCVAGCFADTPIILTKTVQLSLRKNHSRKGTLDSIPEYEADGTRKNASSTLGLQVSDYPNYKSENEDYNSLYAGGEFIEGEDGELSWFNAGVRVGVGIGLSVCLGIGIGVGLLVRTYQGTTRNFRRRLL